jgi:outer membrane protein assembly factor BamB
MDKRVLIDPLAAENQAMSPKRRRTALRSALELLTVLVIGLGVFYGLLRAGVLDRFNLPGGLFDAAGLSQPVRATADADEVAWLGKARIEEPPAVRPEDAWTGWRGLFRDGRAGGPSPQPWAKSGPNKMWEVMGGGGYSSFAVGGGRLYTVWSEGEQEFVACLDAADGSPRWGHSYACSFKNGFGNGPRSTPTLDEGRIYSVGALGNFLCLNAETGERIWEHDLLQEFAGQSPGWGVSFSPLVTGNIVVTCPGGGGGKSVVAFDKVSGNVVWSALDDPPGYSSPVAATLGDKPQVVAFTGNGLAGLAVEDGKLLWRQSWETANKVNAATPIVFHATAGDQTRDYVFISSGYGKGCCLVRIAAEASGSLTAKVVYENNQLCSHFSTPVLHDGFLYGFNEANLTCLDVRTGETRWKKSGLGKGSLLSVGDDLIVFGEQGQLVLAAATPDEYRELASARPFRGKTWTLPALSGKRLFVRDESKIACLEIPGR